MRENALQGFVRFSHRQFVFHRQRLHRTGLSVRQCVALLFPQLLFRSPQTRDADVAFRFIHQLRPEDRGGIRRDLEVSAIYFGGGFCPSTAVSVSVLHSFLSIFNRQIFDDLNQEALLSDEEATERDGPELYENFSSKHTQPADKSGAVNVYRRGRNGLGC